MIQRSKPQGIRKTILNSTVALVGVAAVLTPGVAAAQDAAADEEVIVVTGTRIQRPDYQFTNPVVSSTAEEIANSGETNLLDYLETVPALNNSLNGGEDFTNTTGFAGVDLLNLRNLGVQRTLVLVDGRRHVAGSIGTSAVDVSTIPTDLVQRVDVLTGGASAIYGADGVSGVVNFIMRDDFEGLRLRAEFGAPTEEGQDTQFVAATAGMNFANGRGNITGAIEYSNEDMLSCRQREFCDQEVRFMDNPAASFGGPYSFIPAGNLVWYSSGIRGAVDTDGDFYIANFDGLTDAAWDFGTDFDPPNGVFDSGFVYGQGGSGTPTANYTESLLPAAERFNINLMSHIDITNNLRLYGNVKMVHSEASFNGQPTFDYAYALNLADNPFIPTNIRNDALLNGLTDVYVSQDHYALGVGGETVDRDVVRGVIGIDGEFNEHVRFDVSYVAGQLQEDILVRNSRFEDRFAAAIDVVDPDGAGPLGPTCRATVDPAGYLASYNLNDREATSGQPNYPAPLSFTPGPGSGCVPLNTLGPASNSSAAAVDWIMADLTVDSTVRQQVLTAALSGDFGSFLELPGGSIGWAGGVEWRRETLDSVPDDWFQLGVTQSGPVPITRGGYEVTEGFVEASLPLLRDAAFADSLTLDWAHRYADYSTLGAANTFKFGLSWAPISDITFRATRAEAVRAPNINELFAPTSTDFAFIVDPCDSSELGNAPNVALRTANCNVILAAAGAAPAGTYVDPFAAFQKTGRSGGNPDLGPETAEIDTIGVIYRPSWFSGFTFSADYYDIVLQNAINLTDPQDLANQCVDGPTTVGNPFCAGISRVVGGAGAGGINNYLSAPFNVAEYTTRGIDFTIAYSFDAADIGLGDMGSFDLRAVGNNTQELTFVPLIGVDTDNELGESSSRSPEWQLNFDVTWNLGPWTTHYGYNFSTDLLRGVNASGQDENDAWSTNPLFVADEYKYVDGISSHSLQVRYEVNDRLEVYGGANNIGYDPSPTDLVYFQNGQFLYIGAVARFGAN
ncbi:tonB-dependent receptor [alpha proteobacterium U9-1i]|nr:tonB-dependent receptor [alpha proteobacterium U9-1i]